MCFRHRVKIPNGTAALVHGCAEMTLPGARVLWSEKLHLELRTCLCTLVVNLNTSPSSSYHLLPVLRHGAAHRAVSYA